MISAHSTSHFAMDARVPGRQTLRTLRFLNFFAFLRPAWWHRCSLPYDSRRLTRIAKRYVCAAKSFGALLIMLLTRPADSPKATCVRPARFWTPGPAATRRSGPVSGRQTLRTYWFWCCGIGFAKRNTRNGFRACCLAGCTCLDLSGRQTCVGVRFGDRAFLRLALKSCAVSKTICKRTQQTPSWSWLKAKCAHA